MTYEEMMERLGELEIEAQRAIDAGQPLPPGHRAEVDALERAIESLPEWEDLILGLSQEG